jgi:hypothetical protein
MLKKERKKEKEEGEGEKKEEEEEKSVTPQYGVTHNEEKSASSLLSQCYL